MAENLTTGKNTRRYMLMNPDLYADLTTRLKYATPPAVKNLVATDQEIDAILRDPNLPLREKRRILSDALYRLQLYKSMIDSESVADSMVGPMDTADSSRFTAPAARRRQWDTYRPVISSSTPQQRFTAASSDRKLSSIHPSVSTKSATTTPQLQQQISPTGLLSSSAFQRQLAADDDDVDDDDLQQFATPDPAAAAASSSTSAADTSERPITNVDAEILKYVAKNYHQQAFHFLKAIETLPDDVIKIDPNTLEVMVRGRPAIHIVDLLKEMANTLPPPRGRASTPMPMAGVQSVVGLMARRSNLPASIIKSPRIRNYFVESRKSVMDQQQTSTYASRPQQRQRGMFDDPTLYRDWEGVPRLPANTTRTGLRFK